MDSSAYHRPDAHSNATMSFWIVNLGPHSAYFEGCADPVFVALERDSAGTWQSYTGGPACLDLGLNATLELRPGTSYHAAVRWDIPSRYRLRLYYGDSPAAPYARTAHGAPFELQ